MAVKPISIKGKIFYDPRTERGVYFAYDVEEVLRAAIQYSLELAAEKVGFESLAPWEIDEGIQPDIDKKSITSLKDEILKQIGL
jgi:hypothetical protein